MHLQTYQAFTNLFAMQFDNIKFYLFTSIYFFITSAGYAQFETPPLLSSASFIGSASLQGPGYKIERTTRNDGYMNTYSVNSKYGNFEIRGTYFLIKTLSELAAIEFLQKNYPSEQVAGSSTVETAKNIVTAPIRGAEKLYDTVTDTKKLKKTASSVPGGIYNIFKTTANAVGSVAEFTYETGASVFTGSSSSDKPSKSTGEHLSYAGQQIEKYTLDFIGYNKHFRELAKELQVDPYTDNQRLRSELKRVSSIKSTVGVGARFVPGLYAIPLVGDANKYLGYAEKTALYDDPAEVEKLNKKMLTAFEKDGDGKDTRRFSENNFYSPPMKRELIISLKQLKSVQNIDSLIQSASNAKSKETAKFYLQSIGKLAELHQTSMSFTEILPNVLLPAAITKDGTLLIPLPADYIAWTKEVAEIFEHFHKEVIKDGKSRQASLIIAGGISKMAKNKLVEIGVRKISTGVKFS